MKRTILITGANRGIGLAIARQLAGLGHSVLLGSRDLHGSRRPTGGFFRDRKAVEW